MRKLALASGIGILALGLVSFVGNGDCEKLKDKQKVETLLTELQEPFTNTLIAQNQNELLSVEDIAVIETEDEINLGFDAAAYLPIGFDAYAGMVLDLDEINLIEIEEEIDLGFDTAEYLPTGFDPYQGMERKNTTESENEIGFNLETSAK